MQTWRYHKWREIRERYGYEHPSLESTASSTDSDSSDFQHQSPTVVDLSARHHTTDDKRLGQAQSESVEPSDAEELLEVTFEQRQLQIALERLFTRMKWMCSSHRYHLRHRMLSLVHQHRQKISTKTVAATSANLSDGQSCPVLIAQTKQSVEADVEELLRVEHSLAIPRGKRNEVDNIALKQTVDELFSRGLEETALDRQPSTEGGSTGEDDGRRAGTGLDDDLSTRVVLECATWSRWDLLQTPYYLGTTASGVKQAAQDHRSGGLLIATNEDDSNVDAMLKNEWRLLQLDDAAYMRARLDSLASKHEQRATIAIHVHEHGALTATTRGVSMGRPGTSDGQKIPASVSAVQSTIDGASRTVDNADRPKTAGSATADPLKAALPAATNVMSESSNMIYSLYALRVLSCRTQRRRLLRLLNYAHYLLHVARHASTTDGTADSKRSQKQPRQQEAASSSARSWKISVNSCGEHIVSQEPTHRDDDSADGKLEQHKARTFVSQAKELTFDAARHDLGVLERQMMRIGSHFIRKQEQDHFQRCGDSAGTSNEYAVPTIDRLQVLHDLFECQIAFQRAKLQLVEFLLGNGLLGHLGGGNNERLGRSKGLQIVTSVLQCRALIEFSHDYFVESFASETVHLELQIRLQQQIRGHLLTTSQSFQETSDFKQKSGNNSRLVDERERRARFVLARRSESAKCVARFWFLQEKLLDEAETKWFSATSVTERHALRQSVYEQLLVTWQLITELEIPAAPVHVLERSAVDILTGNGFQVVLPPSLLIDTSRQLYARAQTQTNTSNDAASSSIPGRSLFEWLAAAWHLLEWHQLLAHSIYEAGLLERVYRFQYSFVREMDRANEQARLFFFDTGTADSAGGCDPSATGDRNSLASTLKPIGIQLGLAENGASDAQSVHLDGIHKTVPNWVEHQLWTAVMEQKRRHQEDEASETVEYLLRVAQGDAMLLRLQRRWVEYLGVRVDYHDRVGAHVFEFASSSSFIALEALRQQHRPSRQPGATFTDVDIDLIRVKYASDVVHKMTEEMQQRCYPYWTSLDTLKQRLRSQHAASPTTASAATQEDGNTTSDAAATVIQKEEELERIEQLDHAGFVVRVESAAACCRFLSDAVVVPQRLVQLDKFLQRLRNEVQLMLALGGDAHAMCAFLLPADGGNDDANPDTLSKWFVSKFDQLKGDLQVHDKHASSTIIADSATVNQPGTHNFFVANAADNDSENGDDERDPRDLLLRSVPSFSFLLRQFSPTRHSTVAKPGHSVHTSQSVFAAQNEEGVAGAESAASEQQQQEAGTTALRALVTIYDALVQLVELCRVECALLGGVGQQHRTLAQASGEGHGYRAFELGRHRSSRGALGDTSPPSTGDTSGRKLLSQWQCRFHDRIREHLRDAAGRISVRWCNLSVEQEGKAPLGHSFQPLALFAGPALNKDVHQSHASMMLRLEVESAAQHYFEQHRELVRFALAAAAMQTFADGIGGRRRRSLLLEIDSIITAGVAHLDQHRNARAVDCCSKAETNPRPLDDVHRLREVLYRFPLFRCPEQPPQRQLYQQAELRRLWGTVSSVDLQLPQSTTQEPLPQTSNVVVLAQLLRLQRVFIEEHMDRPASSHGPPTKSASPTQLIAKTSLFDPNLEAGALRSLATAWESYHAIELAHSSDESVCNDMLASLYQQPSTNVLGREGHSHPHNTPGLVSGESLRLKTRLFGDGDTADAHKGGAGTWDGIRWLALECLTLGQQTYTQVTDPAASMTTERVLILPSRVRAREYVRWLHGALEFAWIHRDMRDMQTHYDTLLQYRKQHHEQRSRMNSFNRRKSTESPLKPPPLSILQLASFFIESVTATQCESDSNRTAQSDAFPVPSATIMNQLQHQELAGAYEDSLMLAFKQCEKLDSEVRHLRCRLREAEAEADAKREAHAADYAYALHFKMQALNQQLDLVRRRAESERATMRCELGDEYADKLQSLRVQLLAAGAQFDDFRTQLQSQLTRQLQLAQTRAIEQLVDGGESGTVSATVSSSLSVSAKAALLASLPTEQQQTWGSCSVEDGASSPIPSSPATSDTVARLERENAALKHSILRLQALVAVQQQVQAGARDRELEMTCRHAASDALSRHELEQLRAHVIQLEGDVSRLAQEKARAQQGATRLEQERDQAAQRRREAKARALSAPYYRRETADREGKSDNCRLDDVKGDGAYQNDGPEVLEYRLTRVGGDIKQDVAAITSINVNDNDSCVARRRLAPASAPAVTVGRRALSARGGDVGSRRAVLDWEKMEEAFETVHERAIRSADSGQHDDDEEAARSLAERYQRSTRHQQSEIRRLQQQLARESKLKAAALRQLADMKAVISSVSQQDDGAVEIGDNDGDPPIVVHIGDTTTQSSVSAISRQQQVRSTIPPSLRRAQSAAPCAPMRHRVLAYSAGAPLPSTPKRPSTSFSPRASSLSSSLLTQAQTRPVGPAATSPSQDLARPPSTRGKFHVVKPERASLVGGIAGVPNALSVREPLPYR